MSQDQQQYSRKKQFPFDKFEPYWQGVWEKEKTFSVPNPGDAGFDPSKPKYYVLDMFPYPSGAGLHVGHPEGYTATDIIARQKRMAGYNVLHPMGWDAFGLPAEQHAIKTGEHPKINTERNIDNFRRQLKRLGFAYDWDREINTTDPGYVKWTQWIFLKLYNSYFDEETQKARPVSELEERGLSREEIDQKRLAYVANTPVNWSPDLGTVLANEEVEEWRQKGHTVERRPLQQWMLRITAYAQRFIEELDELDWPEGIKLLQRNWIGRSEGAEVDFAIDGNKVTVFTTRPDTLFGATYMVLSPEHPLVDEIVTSKRKAAVEDYQELCATKSDLERTELTKKKSGEFTGAFAINPVNDEKIPVWIADYVMMSYGTGAIMAVPAHDQRDYEFAKKFKISIRQVVGIDPGKSTKSSPSHEGSIEQGENSQWKSDTFGPKSIELIWKENECYTGEGCAINSGFLDGLSTAEAKDKITAWLEEKNLGRAKVIYKLRDWLFSRQRYWGEPFPIIWKDGQHSGMDESELPLLAPELEDYKPTGDPEPTLSKAKQWVQLSDGSLRETNTMPQWGGSCWYYLRFCDAHNDQYFVGKEAEQYWMGGGCGAGRLPANSGENTSPANHCGQDAEGGCGGVDLYIGGTEHAVLHLLYARFWHKVLHDLGYLSTKEPFQKLVNQGLIMGEDGQKMSKSRGNVVNPDDVVEQYGADSLRLYEMFMGPLEQVKPWSMKGVEGVYRFLSRVWRLMMKTDQEGAWSLRDHLVETEPDKIVNRAVHAAIKKVTRDIESLSFNTAISQMMVCTNELTKLEKLPVSSLVTFLQILNPFAPHLTEELNARLADKFSSVSDDRLANRPWPIWDESFLIEEEVEIVLQVNGKVRDKLMIQKDADKGTVEALALESEKGKNFTEGLTIRKVIVVPGRLVNIVAN